MTCPGGSRPGGLVLRFAADGEPLAPVAARRRARRLYTALARLTGAEVLALAEADGGTVVLPGRRAALPAGTEEELERVCGGPVTLAVHPADSGPAIAAAARTAAEVLRIVRRLHRPPAVYRLEDVRLEFHLSRPDESTAGLAALLDPVYERPELLDTLRAYLTEQQDRRRTARALGLHPNTVDNRLARIGELIGAEATSAHGFALLLTAFTLRELQPERGILEQ